MPIRVLYVLTPIAMVGATVGGFAFGAAHGGTERDELTGSLESMREAHATELEASTEREAQLATEREEARAELERARSRVALLESRRRVARAIAEVDARNFGRAQALCTSAAEPLTELPNASPEVAELGAAIAAHQVEVTRDLGVARSSLVRFGEALDHELDRVPAPVEEPAPEEPSTPES